MSETHFARTPAQAFSLLQSHYEFVCDQIAELEALQEFVTTLTNHVSTATNKPQVQLSVASADLLNHYQRQHQALTNEAQALDRYLGTVSEYIQPETEYIPDDHALKTGSIDPTPEHLRPVFAPTDADLAAARAHALKTNTLQIDDVTSLEASYTYIAVHALSAHIDNQSVDHRNLEELYTAIDQCWEHLKTIAPTPTDKANAAARVIAMSTAPSKYATLQLGTTTITIDWHHVETAARRTFNALRYSTGGVVAPVYTAYDEAAQRRPRNAVVTDADYQAAIDALRDAGVTKPLHPLTDTNNEETE